MYMTCYCCYSDSGPHLIVSMPLASKTGSVWSAVSYAKPTYRFLVCRMQGWYTFSILSVTGRGLDAVTAAAISALQQPQRCQCMGNQVAGYHSQHCPAHAG